MKHTGQGVHLVLKRGRVLILSNEDIVRHRLWKTKGKLLTHKIKVTKFEGVQLQHLSAAFEELFGG